jgi:D-3-phosphoglycerate dehydrogenase
MFKVFSTSRSFGKYCKSAVKMIEEIATLELNPYSRAMKKDELLEIVPNIDAIILGHDQFDREIILAAKKLKIIARHGVGVDNIDIKTATERKIPITITPMANADSVADHTIALMLALLRKVPEAHNSMIDGYWEPKKFIGIELSKKIVGIIGLGKIGFKVAERLQGFGVKIIVYDPFVKMEALKRIKGTQVDLDTLVRNADIITIHCPYTKETENLIDKKEFELMKKNVTIINTARGEIVNESALYEFLKKNKSAKAALDVYTEEPPSEHFKLRMLKNILLTPHISAYTKEAIEKMDLMNARDILLVLDSKKPKNLINPEIYEV